MPLGLQPEPAQRPFYCRIKNRMRKDKEISALTSMKKVVRQLKPRFEPLNVFLFSVNQRRRQAAACRSLSPGSEGTLFALLNLAWRKQGGAGVDIEPAHSCVPCADSHGYHAWWGSSEYHVSHTTLTLSDGGAELMFVGWGVEWLQGVLFVPLSLVTQPAPLWCCLVPSLIGSLYCLPS